MFRTILTGVIAVITFPVAFAHAQQEQTLLKVPALVQQPPPGVTAGWCGEAAIQMIAMYYGCYFPQAVINKMGKPVHPDLYWNDLTVALKAMGFEPDAWPNTAGPPQAFLGGVRAEIREGRPVLVGVKVYSDKNPEGDDHFCVAVGMESAGLRINDTWSTTPNLISNEQLLSPRKGISFFNKQNMYLGLSIKDPFPGDLQVRLSKAPKVSGRKQTIPEQPFSATLSGLKVGHQYQLLQYRSVRDRKSNSGGEVVKVFTASASELVIPIALSEQEIACFAVHAVVSEQLPS